MTLAGHSSALPQHTCAMRWALVIICSRSGQRAAICEQSRDPSHSDAKVLASMAPDRCADPLLPGMGYGVGHGKGGSADSHPAHQGPTLTGRGSHVVPPPWPDAVERIAEPRRGWWWTSFDPRRSPLAPPLPRRMQRPRLARLVASRNWACGTFGGRDGTMGFCRSTVPLGAAPPRVAGPTENPTCARIPLPAGHLSCSVRSYSSTSNS